MFGVGIIGGGRVCHGHAKALAATNGLFALRAIADIDQSRADSLAAQYDCDGYTDYHKLLERPDIDIVTIALPNHLHAQAAIDAARAGKHVFVEKPMALTLEECDAMSEAAQAAKIKMMVGHTQHFFAVNRKAHEIISSGGIGELSFMTDTWYKPFGLELRLPWFLDRAYGGGMWQMNGAHMVDRMIWFSNSPVVAVKASINNKLIKQASDDSSIVMLQHANGLHSTIAHAGYRVGDERWNGEFIGTEGMLKLATFAPNAGLWIARSDHYEEVAYEPNNPFALEFELFAEAIRNNSEEPITPRYARHIVAVLLAAEESARTGREVILSERDTQM
jgi:Predicted dehydrogenases and related proteins